MSVNGRKAKIRIGITGILIIAIIVLFKLYTDKNHERILRQSASYIQNSAEQTSGWIDNILNNARYSITNMARLYGLTLSSEEIKPESLREMADGSLFDYVDFVNSEGIDINVIGKYSDVSDRSYFIKGMNGESGIDGAYTSKITGERMIVFYAPVRYEGRIIGVLTGHYMEARVRDILNIKLFDEPVTQFLCISDGTVVTGTSEEYKERNVMDYLDGRIYPEDREIIADVLAHEKSYQFKCDTSDGTTIAYATSLLDSTWTLIQLFPAAALKRTIYEANVSGITLETELIFLFTAYLVIWLIQEWYHRKRLIKEKKKSEMVVEGINRLFRRFILVNFKDDTYKYLNNQNPTCEGVAPSGVYSEFLDAWKQKHIDIHTDQFMGDVLQTDNLIEEFKDGKDFEWHECQIKEENGVSWENMAVIILEREDNVPTTALIATQEFTKQKEKMLQTQDALKVACESAEAANHAKSDFLSRMSHDIRTPMNAIMGMTAIAAMHIDDKGRVTDCLNKISISSKHLLGLINEVLDMSKIESGKLELIDEEFDLCETINELIAIFNPQIENKKQELSVTISDINHEKVIGDSQRLSQILVNIMGNAVKFTPEGGTITVNVREIPARTPGTVCYEFVITDTGIGMDKEFVDRMFEPFSRANDSVTNGIEGTGLGMSIARNIAHMMNGDIDVKSKKGEGTQIKVTAFFRYISEEDEELSAIEGHHIMVVDDEEVACENACSILESKNMPSVWFTDGDEAVKELVKAFEEGHQYAAVILDWKMPGKDGIQITREIREKIDDDIPIIILTAYDWSAIEQEAIAAGVNEFITKPLFKSRLVYILKKVLCEQIEDDGETGTILEQEEQFLNKKILLVEDNELNMEIAKEILSVAGFDVDEAHNGKEAVDCLEESEPDTYCAVLMDIQMPVMNGYDSAKAIRNSVREDLKTIPIIAMTADAFSSDIRKAEAAGMNGHISKPVDINKLMGALRNWVK